MTPQISLVIMSIKANDSELRVGVKDEDSMSMVVEVVSEGREVTEEEKNSFISMFAKFQITYDSLSTLGKKLYLQSVVKPAWKNEVSRKMEKAAREEAERRNELERQQQTEEVPLSQLKPEATSCITYTRDGPMAHVSTFNPNPKGKRKYYGEIKRQ
jgi:hypothetical protein